LFVSPCNNVFLIYVFFYIYVLVINVGTEVVQCSVRVGLESVVRKSDLIIRQEELLLLASDGCSLKHGRSCNNRMVYFFVITCLSGGRTSYEPQVRTSSSFFQI
jgi:hypothetical protein